MFATSILAGLRARLNKVVDIKNFDTSCKILLSSSLAATSVKMYSWKVSDKVSIVFYLRLWFLLFSGVLVFINKEMFKVALVVFNMLLRVFCATTHVNLLSF